MSSWLRRLVQLLPEPFRQQFGADLVEQIEIDHRLALARGRLQAFLFLLLTATDLIKTAIAEHLSPSWPSPSNPPHRTKDRTTMIENWTNYFRRALHSLRRSPGFSLAVIATLALAIGLNTGIFSVINTVLLDPLPFRDANQLVRITASAPGSDLPDEFGVAPEFLLQYRENSKLIEDISLYNSYTNTFIAGDRIERIGMSSPSTSLFTTLGVTPLLGRLPVEEDESDVIVLSHTLWKTWFGSDRNILGRSFTVSGRSRTVIAVMKAGFWFPNEITMLWIPRVTRANDITPGRFGQPLLARLAPGVTTEKLETELTQLARQIPERFGGSVNYARMIEQHRPVIRPLDQTLLGAASRPLWVLMGAAVLVLVIACANVANLFMVRAERRRRDLAVQRAIGATRVQVIQSQMAEAIVLSTIAGAMAVGLAWASVPLLVQAAPGGVPRLAETRVDELTLLFTFAASLCTALLCGLVPAFRASRADLSRLREAGRGTTRRRQWGRDLLVVAQTSLTLVLLIGAGLLARSFQELREVDPGYETKDVFTFQIAPEGAHLTDAASFARFHMNFMERVRALPGVQSVGIVENVPLNEGLAGDRFRTEESGGDQSAGTHLSYTWAGGDYFQTMEIGVLEGRPFVTTDHVSNLGNLIVSESAARLLWPDQDPIGRRVQRGGEESWHTVVGVVEDILQYGFRDKAEPMLYFPLVGQSPDSRPVSSPGYVVKTGRAEEIAPEVRALVREVAPNAPMYRIFTMEGLARDSMIQLSLTMFSLAITAILALILGALGLYGVLSYVVAERTREIGVRMAMGADSHRVRLMVLGQGLRVVALGVVVGIVAATGTSRVLSSLLFGVQRVDAMTFAGTSLCLLLVGAIATYLPARRASEVDPMESLRSD